MKKYGRNFGRKNMENKKKKLSAYYKPYKGLFLADMVFAMIGAAITLVIPLMVRYITGTVVMLPIEEASSTIIRLGIFMVLLVIVEGYCNYFIGYYGHVMGAKIEHDMRNEIFGHYQKLSFAFFDNQKVGHLLSRITSDLFDITELLHHGPEDVVISAIKLLGAFIILLIINAKLAFVAIGFVVIMLLYAVAMNGRMRGAFGEPGENRGYQQSDRGQSFRHPCGQIFQQRKDGDGQVRGGKQPVCGFQEKVLSVYGNV